MSSIITSYKNCFHKSADLAVKAKKTFPDGVNSDSRHMHPFPIYVQQALGAKKTTVEGKELIDYWAGHGALLFGHNVPEVTAAVNRQMALGTHYGACHSLELEWAELVMELMPSVERIRFTNSGTEANQLAVQLARSFTGKNKVILLEGHYHGWLYPVFPTESINTKAKGNTHLHDARVILPPSGIDLIEQTLKNDPDIACLILEPTGPCSGVVPTSSKFIKALRELTNEYGVLLIFDEVITGFRVGKGGAQGCYAVTPDLTSLGKVIAGGLPGGAVAGRKGILDLLSFDEDQQQTKVAHYGTFSANPLSAVAGIATLNKIKKDQPYELLNQTAQLLQTQLNELFTSHLLDWTVYGEFSCLKFLIGHGRKESAQDFIPQNVDYKTLLKRGKSSYIKQLLICSLLTHGIDLSFSSVITTAHTTTDIDKTVLAFDQAIFLMKQEGILSK